MPRFVALVKASADSEAGALPRCRPTRLAAMSDPGAAIAAVWRIESPKVIAATADRRGPRSVPAARAERRDLFGHAFGSRSAVTPPQVHAADRSGSGLGSRRREAGGSRLDGRN